MKLIVSAAAAVLALASLAPQSVDAHGFISEPKAVYTGGSSYTSFSAEITASVNKGFSGRQFGRSPEQNVAEFTAAWPSTGYTSLKQMMDAAVPGCGYTDPNAAPVDVSNLSSMKYQNNEYKEGFLNSHHGPCEGWIDNTKVFHYDDCVKSFPGYPASIPVNYGSCKGTCRLTFYWLAVHSSKWQAYKGCVPIKNGSGGGSTTAGEAETTTTTTNNNGNNNKNNNNGSNNNNNNGSNNNNNNGSNKNNGNNGNGNNGNNNNNNNNGNSNNKNNNNGSNNNNNNNNGNNNNNNNGNNNKKATPSPNIRSVGTNSWGF